MTGAKLTDEQKRLHEGLMSSRNKVIAHSDADMMRIASRVSPVKLGDDFEFMLLQTAFDEGLTFIGAELWKLNELLHVVSGSLHTRLLMRAQEDPNSFNLDKDYLQRA